MLVTGGAGFIGANYVRLQVKSKRCEELVVLDALTYAGNRASLADLEHEGSIKFIHGDIQDTPLVEELLHEHAISTLVHFAAESHVDRSIEDPDAFISANVNGTHSLLKAARNVWLGRTPSKHRFHHVSTDEVYGTLSSDAAPFCEDHQYQPNSPYAASKAASDHLVRAYHRTFGLDVSTTNCSNNYGPYQFPEKLIPLMIVNILHGKPLPMYGDGEQVRDWLHVSDHCRAIDLAIEKGRSGEVYNIGAGNERSNIEIVRHLCSLLEERFAASELLRSAFPDSPAARGDANESLITYVVDRLGHDRRYAMDFNKAALELDYKPLETFESGFARTVDWYLSEQAWWRKVMDGSYRDWIDTNYVER